MRVLKKLNEERLLFFDIETAPIVPALELDTQLFDSWAYKVNKDGKMSNDEIIESFVSGTDKMPSAGIFPEFSRIVCIVVGKIVKGEVHFIKLTDFDEAKLLKKFNDVLERNIKDRLVGFVNIAFDAPFIYKRMLIKGVTPHDKIDSSGLKPWDVVDIDLAMEWKGNSYDRASLLNVSTALGLPSPKSDISGAQVGMVYWTQGDKGLDRIVDYCVRDVLATVNVFRKMRLQDALPMAKTLKSANMTEVIDEPVIVKLFNGAKYTAKIKKDLTVFLKKLDDETLDKAYTVLEAMTSTAKGKETNIKKAHLKALKTLVNEK